jgi:hypothetical protein
VTRVSHALDGGTIRLDELTIRRDELAKSVRASAVAPAINDKV